MWARGGGTKHLKPLWLATKNQQNKNDRKKNCWGILRIGCWCNRNNSSRQSVNFMVSFFHFFFSNWIWRFGIRMSYIELWLVKSRNRNRWEHKERELLMEIYTISKEEVWVGMPFLKYNIKHHSSYIFQGNCNFREFNLNWTLTW